MLTLLTGYRTYILGTLGVVVAILALVGLITPDAALSIETALGFGGLITLRAAVKNIAAQ